MIYAFFFADGRVERHEVDDEFVLLEVTLKDWNNWEGHHEELFRIWGRRSACPERTFIRYDGASAHGQWVCYAEPGMLGRVLEGAQAAGALGRFIAELAS